MTTGQLPRPSAGLLDRLEDDPYPVYRQFRMAGPVIWSAPQEHWFVLGHRHAMAVLRDRRLVGAADVGAMRDAAVAPAAGHAHRRGLVENAFTPTLVERYRPFARRRVDTLLDEAESRGRVDVVTELAAPLALTVTAELMGLPPDLARVAGAWVQGVSDGLAPPRGHRMRPGGDGPVVPPDEVRDGLAAVIGARRNAPGDDLLGTLVATDGSGGPDGPLERGELLDVCVELLVSAYLSAVDVIGNGVRALLDNPLQTERLRTGPDLVATGVEELLRYDPPIQRITRFATEDVELDGHTLACGQTIVVLIGAANRDPEVFDAPDALDLSRSPNHHVSFGRGARFCLGAPLARMEAQVAIGSLVARCPTLRQAGEPRRRAVRGARGFSSLPLAL